jgi:hypothetical protein
MTQIIRPSKIGLPLAACVAALALGAGALAQRAPVSGPARAPALQAVIDCRPLTDAAQRLACYDKAAAGLDQAEAKGEVVVVDREQVREAGRQAFGFSFRMPEVFTRGEKPETLDQLTATAARAYQGADGKWTVELEDGAVWRQVDSEPVKRAPKKGSKVELRKAAMGSYFMNIDGQRAVRAQRQNR